MSKFYIRLLCVSLPLLPFFAMAGVNDYFDAVDQINQEFEEIGGPHANRFCPGLDLVLSCGNGACGRGETEINCPADCSDSPVKSYDNSMVCAEVQQFFEPRSISQVQDLINYASNAVASVRVVGTRHSVNNQYCNDGIIIGTANLNKIIGIERNQGGSESVWVEPGVTVGDLAEWLHTRNRTLGYAQLGFRLATVGGAIANGAHGSSIFHTAVISNIVEAVTLVDSNGRIREISEGQGETDEIRAARAHLGVLGPIVKVKLKIIPQFRLRVDVTTGEDALLLRERGVFKQAEACDYALINWFPNTHRFVKTCGVQTQERAEDGAENSLLNPPVPSILMQPYKAVLHLGICHDKLNAAIEGVRYLQLKWIPPIRKADDFGYLSSTYHAVGYSHRMMTSALIRSDKKFFTNDWELAVPYSQAQNAVRAVSLYAEQTGMRLPLVGMFLRFAPSEEKTLLAHTTSVGKFKKGEPVVFFEFPTPVPVGFGELSTNEINRTYEELARLLITQFGARLHWGKNKQFAFGVQKELKPYGDNFDRFNAVRHEFDPSGMFVTDFDVNAGF